MSLIRKLYKGKLCPFAVNLEQHPNVYDKHYSFCKKYEELLEGCDENLQDKINEVVEACCGVGSLINEESFVQGFTIGIKLMTEAFVSDSEYTENR